MMMTESDFNDRVHDVIYAIEGRIEESGVNVDMESTGEKLTLRFNGGITIEVNPERPVRQIWIAADSAGYHFDFDDLANRWVNNANGEELFSTLSRICTEQAGKTVHLA